nr:syntaxin-12 isoform X1 [Callithrix jacchus]
MTRARCVRVGLVRTQPQLLPRPCSSRFLRQPAAPGWRLLPIGERCRASRSQLLVMSYGPLDMYRNPGPSGPQLRDFSSIIQTCSGNIQRISQATAQIKNLMSQLGTKQDSTKLQENLQQLQHSTNQLAKETNELLKELGSLPLPLSASEQRQQRLQKERLMNDFSAALNNFQAVQRRVSEKEKESIARARAGSRLSAEERQREEQLVSFDSHEEWNQMQSQEDEVAITEQDLELIKERETAIRQLEADILDVNQIFKDLAMMIHDQGDLIDSIEANVESSEVHVERATEQLQRAAYYQKKSRKKMCILVLVLSVIVLILGLIIWLVYKTK